MTEKERRAFTRRVATELSKVSDSTADAYLEAASSVKPTPADWNFNPKPVNRKIATELLLDQDFEVTVALGDMFDLEPEGEMSASEINLAAFEEAPSVVSADGPIFVVHGHAHGRMHETVRVLERATGREVIVLHEQPNKGRTLIEKFEQHATSAAYAVVLLTADDEGGAVSETERRPRGRQNVVFELGFFFGMLGRERVAVLLDSGVEKPSDIDGIVYISLDAGGAWKHALGRELITVDIPFDNSRVP